MPGFDRFTEEAQDAVTRAYEVMMRHEHSQLDIEHIVVALLEQGSEQVQAALEDLHVDVEAIRQRVEDVLHSSTLGPVGRSAHPQQVYITPRVKRMMERSN